jgi:hypothetical protein
MRGVLDGADCHVVTEGILNLTEEIRGGQDGEMEDSG